METAKHCLNADRFIPERKKPDRRRPSASRQDSGSSKRKNMGKTKVLKLILLLLLAWPAWATAQSLHERISSAVSRFTSDPRMSHAIISMTVLDARTGQTVFGLSGQVGMAPASCQKTITAASALFMLGPDFRYQTTLSYTGTLRDHVLTGDLVIKGSGDPTLGSWRYGSAKMEVILSRWVNVVKAAGIRKITGRIIGDASAFDTQMPPDGWIWQDIGNYYGAGTSALTWHENQYDLHLVPGNSPGEQVRISRVDPPVSLTFINELTTGKPGSGDRTYLYAAPYADFAYVRGTAPQDIKDFVVSGAVTDPALFCAQSLETALKKAHIPVTGSAGTVRGLALKRQKLPASQTAIDRYLSPPIDSILYWFLKRSINLYGEQLLKTIALHAGGAVSTDSGVAIEKRFWKSRGIDPGALHVIDGSGLSPGNRVTTGAMAEVLFQASRAPWFQAYRNCLPVIHNIRMKSGHINEVCSYAGFLDAKDGTPLIFSFIVNNYEGATAQVRAKMFHTLDLIKE